ncbi:MAG: ABC transporter permease [Promethearchaeota archaeon]
MKSVVGKFFRNGIQQVWIPFNLAKKNVICSKYRSTLIILGILLTIALETGIVISVDTLYDDFILDNRNQNLTDISVIPTKWANLSTLRSLAKDIQSISGVSRASPVYALYSTQILSEELPGSNTLVYGIDSKTHPDFNFLNITKGKREVSRDTVIVSQRLLEYSGFNVGDTFITPPELGLIPKQFTIGGVMSDLSFFGNNAGCYFILVDIENLLEVIPDSQQASLLNAKIDISCKDLLNIKKTGENIKDELGMDFLVFKKDISEIKAIGIHTYQNAMNLVIIVSFIVEFLFITNILAISIRDRSREFGILRAVGQDSTQLLCSIAIEILIYSTIGTIFGMFIGTWFAYLLVGLMQNFYPTLNFQALSLQSSSLIATFASGIIVALISGFYPLFLALSMPVVQNIHSHMRSGRSSVNIFSYWKYTISVGVLLAITGFLLQMHVGPSRFLEFEILSMHFIVIMLIFIGTLLIEVGILVFLPKVAFKLLFLIGTITRTISMRNIAREFQKSLFTIMTLALALAFIIVVGLVSAGLIKGVPIYFQEQWESIDLVAESWDNQLPSITLINQFDQDQNITHSSFIQEARTKIEKTDSYVFGVDPEKYAYFAEEVLDSIIEYPSYHWLNQSVSSHINNDTYALVSDLLLQKLLVPLGSNVRMKIANNNTVNVTISAVIKSNIFLGDGEYLYISTNRFQEFFNSTLAKWFVFEIEGDVHKVRNAIVEIFPHFKELIEVTFYTQAIERSLIFQSAIFQVLFIESFILAGFAQFICILVSTYRMEREIGIMRSLGLHKRGVFGVFMIESITLGLTSIFIGVLDGLLCTFLLARYISSSIPIGVEFQLHQVVLWLFLSFLITLGSPLLPAYRSSGKNVVNIISRRPMKKELDSISVTLWEFVRDRSHQLKVVFLSLMVILTFNYVVDEFLLMWGLIPFDLILYFLVALLEKGNFNGDYANPLVLINPFFYIVSLTMIGPISYYLIHKSLPRNLIKKVLLSGFWGIVGNTICFILFIIQILFTWIFLIPLLEQFNIDSTFNVCLYILIISVEIILFQQVWGFLILRGLNTHHSLKQDIFWRRENGLKGQGVFFGLILMHSIIQIILFTLSSVSVNILENRLSYNYLFLPFIQPELFQVHPVVFLILGSFEVGFFLLLIIYQICTNTESFQRNKSFTINTLKPVF